MAQAPHGSEPLPAGVPGRRGPTRSARLKDLTLIISRGDNPQRRTARPGILAAIAVGGGLGASARYGITQVVHAAPGSFPWATFWTNISGSFALGLLLIVALERFGPSTYVRAFLATGFLGAFTTYSTYAVETDLLLRDGHFGVAFTYAFTSLLAGLGAVWLGIAFARMLPLGKGNDDDGGTMKLEGR